MLDRVGGPETLPELLAESDFIVLAAPLTPETEEMINAETLAMVKPGAWLINVARGRLIDERALLRALRDGQLGGAVLDTFRDEPLAADVAVLRPAQRHRHAAHRVVERPGPRSERRAVLRQPAPLRGAASRCSTWSTRAPGTDPGDNRPMQIAIVGLAGSGKTTVFNTLTRGHAETGGYGGVTLNVGVVKVPDERLDTLAAIFKPKKIVQADVTYVDLPAPPPSTEGHVGTEELPADHLARLRDSDALLHVVRAFEDPANPASRRQRRPGPRPRAARPRVPARRPVDGRAPDRAAQDERPPRQPGRARGGRTRGRRPAPDPRRARGRLADPRPRARRRRREGDPRVPVPDPEAGARPAQRRRGRPGDGARRWSPRSRAGYDHRHALVEALSAKIEMELGELEPDEAAVFMEELGIAESGLGRVIDLSYRLLGLISFLTAGPDEVRAWPIPDGSTAVDAAGAIHTDLAKGFIRAETVAYEDLLTLGSMAEARKAGRLRSEGKTYRVRDGDVLEILFSK